MRIAFLDKDQAIAELRDAASHLCTRDGRVLAVGLFGSLARGQALPSSDADVLIVLHHHQALRWFDRIPEYADAFTGTSLPVEPFAYTRDEIQRMLSVGVGFMRTVFREIIPLAGDPGLWEELRAGF